MQQAEMVTFGGGKLNRKANFRDDSNAVEKMCVDGGACILPLWKGKPLVHNAAPASLHLVDTTHPILAHKSGDPIFLGLADTQPFFAVDVSDWQPPKGSEVMQDGVFFDPSQQVLPASDGVFTELRGVMAELSTLDAEIAATARAILMWHVNHGFCAACGAKSHVVQAGWQRSCPQCDTQHFPRTDPVVIMLVTDGNSVLLGRSPGWPGKMYSLLAGFVEPGETIEAAVRREVDEEVGVKIGAVTYLASQPWPYPSSIMIGCHATALSREISVDPHEIEDAFWLTREQVLEVYSGNSTVMTPPRDGAIASFLLTNWLADRLD